jgi:hypothetical protein
MRFIRTIKWNADVAVDCVGQLASTCLSEDGLATKKQFALQLSKCARFPTEALLQPEEIPKREVVGHIACRSGSRGKVLSPPRFQETTGRKFR